jgi:RimJ/RimL family protein N-acetyltransferase
MPADGEAEATAFYEGLLGIPRVPKPPHLEARGGCWFERGPLKVHLGVDVRFRPAHKAHPALLVDDLAGLRADLREADVELRDDEPLDGYDRVYVDDPFGNRVELLEPLPRIGFRPMRHDDLGLVVRWLAEPEVAKWWTPPADGAAIEAKYGPRIDGSGDPTSMWIAEVDDEPAGLFQSYRHADHPEHDAAVGVPDAVGIDYLIGGLYRGRNLAGRLLYRFARTALGHHRGTTSCVATAARDNEASWRALERAGFRRSHPCGPRDEPPTWVYVFDPR